MLWPRTCNPLKAAEKTQDRSIPHHVGLGGYGEVYLARKQETGKVCALEKMRKRTLFKLDEVFIVI